MARYHDQAAIYDVANTFAEECLFEDGSFFWPGEQVWTEENLDAIWREFAEKPDEGGDSFVAKWTKQLANLPVGVFRLAYEVTALYCLYPSARQFGPDAKNRLLDGVLAMGQDLGQRNQTRSEEFQLAIAGNGIGMTGAGYLTNRPFHIGLYLAFARVIKHSAALSLANLSPKDTLGQALEMVGETMHHQPLASMNIILHIFWPDEFEETSSADYKQRISKNLSDHFGLTPLDDVDETILQARKHMEDEKDFPKDFNLYQDDVRPLWDKAKTQKVSRKFALAALFRERVLELSSSFLWPNEENVWTAENAREALNLTKHLAGKSQDASTSELVNIVSGASREIYQVLCDVRAATILKDLMPRASADREIQKFLEAGGPFDGDEQTLKDLISSSSNTFPGSIDGKAGVPTINHFLVVLGAITAIFENPETTGNRDAMVQLVLEMAHIGEGIMFFPFWTLFYLMYPEQVPPMPAWSSRERVRRAFRHMTENNEYPNYMAEVADIRRKLDPSFDPYLFDFFVSPWKEMWQSGNDEL